MEGGEPEEQKSEILDKVSEKKSENKNQEI